MYITHLSRYVDAWLSIIFYVVAIGPVTEHDFYSYAVGPVILDYSSTKRERKVVMQGLKPGSFVLAIHRFYC